MLLFGTLSSLNLPPPPPPLSFLLSLTPRRNLPIPPSLTFYPLPASLTFRFRPATSPPQNVPLHSLLPSFLSSPLSKSHPEPLSDHSFVSHPPESISHSARLPLHSQLSPQIPGNILSISSSTRSPPSRLPALSTPPPLLFLPAVSS